MDIDTIIEDIAQHSDSLFKETLDLIDDNFNFIDENGLIEPKKDYLILTDFLNKTINHFSNLDYAFLDDPLRKLHRDVNNLEKLLKEQENNLNKVEDLFNARIFPKFSLFKQMQKNLIDLKNSDILTSGDEEMIHIAKEHFKDMQNQYIEMKKIYLEVFIEEYTRQTKDIIKSLEIILNTKIYYLDKFLWINTIKSSAILRAINTLENEHKTYTSKEYLELRISVALPYTQDYKYLQKCLRIYR